MRPLLSLRWAAPLVFFLPQPLAAADFTSHFQLAGNVDSPTAPWVAVARAPAYGTSGALEGQSGNFNPATHRIAVQIEVNDIWWTKPTAAAPLVAINANGTWSCPVVSGGADTYATRYHVRVFPVGIQPPVCVPCIHLPVSAQAVASTLYARPPLPRALVFAGYTWTVRKRDYLADPGPNYFADGSHAVWVDAAGLHLTIARRNGRWECSEVILDKSLGYGTYIFQTRGRVDLLDPNAVAGMFTWETAPEVHNREIDIEIARWGIAGDPTAWQGAIQPCHQCPQQCPANCQRFALALDDQDNDMTFYIVWLADRVTIRGYRGRHLMNPPAERLVGAWTYTGPLVPAPGKETIRVNFWLLGGAPPHNGQAAELLLTHFAHSAQALE